MAISVGALGEIMQQAGAKYLQSTNVAGLTFGEKIVANRSVGRFAIRLYVREKMPAAEVDQQFLFPKELGGIETDVVQGEARARASTLGAPPASASTILEGGIEVDVPSAGKAGTLANIVLGEAASNPFLLTNFHVGLDGSGNFLDGVPCSLYSQAPFGVKAAGLLDGRIDAAIIRPSRGLAWQNYIPNVGSVPHDTYSPYPPGTILDPGLPIGAITVSKNGRTTGYTVGSSLPLRYSSYNIDYGPGRGVIQMTNMYQINPGSNPIADHGDSGSLWVEAGTGTRRAYALHFAAIYSGDSPTAAVGIPIDYVFERLGIWLPAENATGVTP